jgi:hypothetical protein
MEVYGQLHAAAAFPQRKSPCYSFDRRVGGSQSRSERGDEEKNSHPLPMMMMMMMIIIIIIQMDVKEKLKYKNLRTEFQGMWNMKCFVTPVITVATGIVTKGLKHL